MTEDELIRSINKRNEELPEQSTKAELMLPSVCEDKTGALAALKRFKRLCAQRNTRCVMCDEVIPEYFDTIGRKVENTTYCGERCTMAGRSLLMELKQAAGLGLGGDA